MLLDCIWILDCSFEDSEGELGSLLLDTELVEDVEDSTTCLGGMTSAAGCAFSVFGRVDSVLFFDEIEEEFFCEEEEVLRSEI